MILSFTDEAKEDLVEIYQFIGDQSMMRKRRFADEFRRCLALVKNSPKASPIFRGRIRVRAMRRFGFGIFFRLEDAEIIVGAIVHLKRRLGGIRKRFS